MSLPSGFMHKPCIKKYYVLGPEKKVEPKEQS